MALDLPLVLMEPRLLDTVASTTSRIVDMLTRQHSPPVQTKSFHLSCLDQNVVRVYIQTLCIFPFADQNNAEAAIQALGAGLRLTLKKFPFLAGTLTLADREAGKLALEYPSEVSEKDLNSIFRSKQIHYHDTDFPHTYEQLKRDGMPPSAFKSRMFVPEDLANYPGVPADGEGKIDFNKSDAPAMRSQAFFIPGGLVLSMYMHHSVFDFSGVTLFWQTFSANVSSVSGQRSEAHRAADTSSTAERQSLLRQAVDEEIPQLRSDVSADCYCDGPPDYLKTLPSSTKCTQRLIVIPAARVCEYRELLRSYFPKDNAPTICNVLAALVWTHVTRARAARLLKCGLTETNLGIATDLRRRQNPPVPADYMGNMALFSRGTLNVSDLIAEDRVTTSTIVHVINEIKSTISGVDDDWVSRHLSYFKSTDHITDTEIALGITFGSDMYISSWINFGADLSWGIPGTDLGKRSLAGRAEFIRRSYGPGDGGMIFLPRRRQPTNGAEAPFEILVRLAEEDMTRVLDEECGLSSWAEAVIE
ncbi:Transferase domain containing protein [Pyrenophora teres f. teres]|uniref:Transferase domain containing protein n=1 Tax=Pyrenophora teres f. teres TaxID=97479 RepID=A0A6S6W7L5_9PLEO|nr:Transferase domain containing protein [Pyrenophora teres f. teres]